MLSRRDGAIDPPSEGFMTALWGMMMHFLFGVPLTCLSLPFLQVGQTYAPWLSHTTWYTPIFSVLSSP
jgi:hypothetical protein